MACALWLGAAAAFAQDAPAPSRFETCLPLLREKAGDVRAKMDLMVPVFGKRSHLWTREDYAKVADLARYCDGVQARDGRSVDARDWQDMLAGAAAHLQRLNELAAQVEGFAKTLRPEQITLPPCQALVDYSQSEDGGEDSSAEVFGRSFLAMSDHDLDVSVRYVNQCLVFLPKFSFNVKSWGEGDTKAHVNRIIDAALLVLKRRQDWAQWERKDTDIVVMHDGGVVPPTMTIPLTRELIVRYNKAAALKRRFTPETISVLMRNAEEILEQYGNASTVTIFDKLYAEEVKRRVQEDIFRRH